MIDREQLKAATLDRHYAGLYEPNQGGHTHLDPEQCDHPTCRAARETEPPAFSPEVRRALTDAADVMRESEAKADAAHEDAEEAEALAVLAPLLLAGVSFERQTPDGKQYLIGNAERVKAGRYVYSGEDNPGSYRQARGKIGTAYHFDNDFNIVGASVIVKDDEDPIAVLTAEARNLRDVQRTLRDAPGMANYLIEDEAMRPDQAGKFRRALEVVAKMKPDAFTAKQIARVERRLGLR